MHHAFHPCCVCGAAASKIVSQILNFPTPELSLYGSLPKHVLDDVDFGLYLLLRHGGVHRMFSYLSMIKTRDGKKQENSCPSSQYYETERQPK